MNKVLVSSCYCEAATAALTCYLLPSCGDKDNPQLTDHKIHIIKAFPFHLGIDMLSSFGMDLLVKR